MKHSIRIKMTLTMVVAVILAIAACWCVNWSLLGKFYRTSKVKSLVKTFESVRDNYDELAENSTVNTTDTGTTANGTASANSDASLAIEKLSENQDMSIYIFNIYSNGSTYFLVSQYPEMNRWQLETLTARVGSYLRQQSETTSGNQENANTAENTDDTLPGTLNSAGQDDVDKNDKFDDGTRLAETMEYETLEKTDDYGVYMVKDNRLDSNYIELFGTLEDGAMVYIHSNFESIQDSAAIANRFLAYVGIVCGLISALIMFFISKSFAEPIVKLSHIAGKMSHLDFSEKYKVTTKDEVGDLGESINTLSSRLETTISELKTANNELQQDIAHKVEVDEMRKEFLSNVTHELKTPIALIQGYAEGLADNVNDDAESRSFYCDVIMDEAKKMNSMVQKLLSLNQLEFGTQQAVFERFDLSEMLRAKISAIQVLADEKETPVFYEEPDGPVYAWADEFMLEEVVTNYLSNALNHIDTVNGQRKITVTVKQLEKVARVSVFNTGENIPEEDLDKIWIKFYKVDKARTRAYGGSGIGLSIVKAVMNALHQECGVINRENGVEFWFEVDTNTEDDAAQNAEGKQNS